MIDGQFWLRFEYIAENGDTVRSEHHYGPALLSLENADAMLGKKVAELRSKVVNALKEDGIIPPPSNVIRIDFQKRRVAA